MEEGTDALCVTYYSCMFYVSHSGRKTIRTHTQSAGLNPVISVFAPWLIQMGMGMGLHIIHVVLSNSSTTHDCALGTGKNYPCQRIHYTSFMFKFMARRRLNVLCELTGKFEHTLIVWLMRAWKNKVM